MRYPHYQSRRATRRNGKQFDVSYVIERIDLDRSGGSPHMSMAGFGMTFVESTVVEEDWTSKYDAMERTRQLNLRDYGLNYPSKQRIEKERALDEKREDRRAEGRRKLREARRKRREQEAG